MSFNRWGSIVDGVDPVNTTETSISEIRSDGVSILSGGSLQHIETQVASGDSSIDFTNVFASDDGYDRYELFVDNAISSDQNEAVQIQFSSDGGSTWDSGTTDYAYARFNVRSDGSTFTSGSSGTSQINISALIGDGSSVNDNGAICFTISNPTNSNKSTITKNSSVFYEDTQNSPFFAEISGGIRLTQSTFDSIRFLMDIGNITSGIFSVYGVDN